jgi:hypothetical protein
MIEPHIIQADIVADILTQASITDLLASAAEVREDQYQGTVYGYPAIRVDIISQTPIVAPWPCDLTTLNFTLRVYTEGGSSKSNSIILGAINNAYHRKIFGASTWNCWFRSAGVINPAKQGTKLWRGEAIFTGTVYPTSGAL